MKYSMGDIVLLYSGETVYIYQVDKKQKVYYASNCDDENDLKEIKDSDIFQKVLSV